MKFIYSIAVFLCLVLSNMNAFANTVKPNVLLVISGYGKADGSQPGYEFSELSKAYAVLNTHGITVDIASPQGGTVTADKYNPKSNYNAQMLNDTTFMRKLNNSLPINTIQAEHYQGLFVIGGKGAMFDLPNNKALQTLIADVYQRQGVVAAVCHGPAALVNVKLANGQYLVANKQVNSFTNQEERLFGKKWLAKFDFLLEDKLIERGAQFTSSPIMLNHVAVDERLITGQNPTSTIGVAQAIVAALNIKAIAVEQEAEDKALALIAQFLSGDKTVLPKFLQKSEAAKLPLVANYSILYFKAATTLEQVDQALTLMNAVHPAISNPSFALNIAKAQQRLGKTQHAQQTLQGILAKKPDFQAAKDMLKAL